MTKIKFYFLILAALLFYSAVISYQGDYGTESVFMTGAGAKADAMAAFTACADDASAVFYNPAGLLFSERQAVSFLHYQLYENAMYNLITYIFPALDIGVLGATLYRFSSGSIDGFSSSDMKLNSFSVNEYKFSFSYARDIINNFYAGMNFNVYTFNLSDLNSTGIGFDAGVLYEPFSFLRVGLMVHNLIKPLFSMKVSNEDLPQRYFMGLLLKNSISDFNLSFTSDFILGERENFKIKSGAEINWKKIIAARAGFDDGRLSYGAGIDIFNFTIDYAYQINNDLGGIHKITLTYSFGLTLKEQKQEKTKKMMAEIKKLAEAKYMEKIKSKAEYYYKIAYELYNQEKYEEALLQTEKALEWYPEYENGIKMKNLLEYKIQEKFKNEFGLYYKKENKEYVIEGINYYIKKDYENAIYNWQMALKIDPQNETLKKYIEKANFEMNARKKEKKLSTEEKQKAEKIYYEAVNAYTSGNLETAVILWKKVLEINPDDIKTMRNLEKVNAEIEELKKRGIK
jgi:tetratricopeptide (TPR) repeat protein